jgi:hypothetical protein
MAKCVTFCEKFSAIANHHVMFDCTKHYNVGDGLKSRGISTGESTLSILGGWCFIKENYPILLL